MKKIYKSINNLGRNRARKIYEKNREKWENQIITTENKTMGKSTNYRGKSLFDDLNDVFMVQFVMKTDALRREFSRRAPDNGVPQLSGDGAMKGVTAVLDGRAAS